MVLLMALKVLSQRMAHKYDMENNGSMSNLELRISRTFLLRSSTIRSRPGELLASSNEAARSTSLMYCPIGWSTPEWKSRRAIRQGFREFSLMRNWYRFCRYGVTSALCQYIVCIGSRHIWSLELDIIRCVWSMIYLLGGKCNTFPTLREKAPKSKRF